MNSVYHEKMKYENDILNSCDDIALQYLYRISLVCDNTTISVQNISVLQDHTMTSVQSVFMQHYATFSAIPNSNLSFDLLES